jgi:hypothetical protein
MSEELSTFEESVKEILVDIMNERVMFVVYKLHRREECKPPCRLLVDLDHPEL